MKILMIWVSILLLALALIGPVLAQVSSHFDLSWNLLSSGGGSRNSANYQIDDVLGQWPDGQSTSTHYQIDSGFWPAGRGADASHLYLPLVLNPDTDHVRR